MSAEHARTLTAPAVAHDPPATTVGPNAMERQLRGAGKEIRKWRLLFDIVAREVDHLRRDRRLARRAGAERAARRRTQLAATGLTTVDELLASHARLTHALEQSVALQSLYAALLNDHDGGRRLQFATAAAWLARLDALARTNGGGTPT